ncbi:spore germination protein GerPE [Bacillus sp. V3B]|uniref:spore germination protein GerPE n=1 Tax=Bacillus sp. V3B TaxID=2804915 RepID=UPI00210BDC23|nr:spore germination protein GerPE [Bacillus sp. V3B]MCQ6274359.1 spore germination protein GerPE [Bacillus sp. V3B]
MLKRTAKVDALKVKSAGISSVIQIGDSNVVNAFTRAIAVQRQKELFYSHEADFHLFDLFSKSLPLPSIDEAITTQTTSLNPIIKVGMIDVIGISSSAILHIGNSEHVQTEARVLHIRQLESTENNSDNATEED